jgi:hypothetical protein
MSISGHSEVATLAASMPDGPFDWDQICERSDMTVAPVRRHLGRLRLPRYFKLLSANPAVTDTEIEASRGLPWQWSEFGRNKSLKVDFYRRHQSQPINWFDIKHLSRQEMLQFPDKPLNWAIAWQKAKSLEQRALVLLHNVNA